jgi:hypothetical protein
MSTTLPRLTFQQAKLAKEKGFDWPVRAYYTIPNEILNENELLANCNATEWWVSAPENALFLQWARKVKGIDAAFVQTSNWEQRLCPAKFMWIIESRTHVIYAKGGDFDDYPEAESFLVDEILKLL